MPEDNLFNFQHVSPMRKNLALPKTFWRWNCEFRIVNDPKGCDVLRRDCSPIPYHADLVPSLICVRSISLKVQMS